MFYPRGSNRGERNVWPGSSSNPGATFEIQIVQRNCNEAMKLTCQVSWFCPTPKTRPIIESPLFGLCTVPPNLYTFILGLKTAQLNFF